MRNGRAFLFALTIFTLSAATELYPADKNRLEPSGDSIIRIVTQIQRADYEGDRPLKRLHDDLTPIPEDKKLASRVLYWRGFALWRRAINGFNDSPTPTDLEADLTQAVTDFKNAIARDPAFVELKIWKTGIRLPRGSNSIRFVHDHYSRMWSIENLPEPVNSNAANNNR